MAAVSFVIAVGAMLYIRLFRSPDGSRLLVNTAGAAAGSLPETESPDALSETE